ncbi:MAG: channel protein TolC [Betaproteobacteria bacterium]|nr:channel protein TolC [Betaproteobacteria bacterium]
MVRNGILALAVAAALASPAAQAVDLLESYRLALQNDRDYRVVQARARAEAESVPQALSQLLPNISAQVGRNQVEQERTTGGRTDTFPRYPTETDNIQLRQPIIRLRSAFALQQAREEVRASEAEVRRERQAVGVRVASAYFEALLAKDRLNLLAAQRRNIETRLLAAQKALVAGVGVRTDIDEARAQLDKIRAQEIGINQNIRNTVAQLELLVGQGVDALAPLDVSKLSPESFDPGDVETLLDIAIEKSPEILARAARVDAARAAIKAAKSDHLPTLDAVLAYNRSLSDNPFFTNSEITTQSYGIQLNIPIYSGGLVSSRVREAVAQSEESQERYFSVINAAKVQLRKDYSAIKEGIAQIRAFEVALQSAEQALLSNQKGVQAGTRTSLDVLFVEQQRFQVQLDLMQSRYQVLAAWVRLNSLIGTMDDEEFARLNQLLAAVPRD